MELHAIADALELPPGFLLSESPFDHQPGQGRELAEALETIRVLAERLQSER